ncbi:MAG: TetR/AcrR family transcriptional regulator [Gammaproteobacteria bacterium]
MSTVNTRERMKAAALALFAEQGYAATSIAAIETAAGLAPRAGAFYRHFPSKEALFEELASERITETPGEFDFEGLRAFDDTRAELVTLARQFEKAAQRQKPYVRLIEEARLTEAGRSFEQKANDAMLRALMDWAGAKPAARGMGVRRLAALTMQIFGGWLFYLAKRQQGVDLPEIDRDTLLEDWASRWSNLLDQGS